VTIDPDPDWWQKLFDDVYLQTDARSVDDVDVTRREIDLLCDLLPLKPEHRIVDLCGGQGRHSLELASRGFRNCTVVDYSECLVEAGRERARRVDLPVAFVRADARATGLVGDSFDWALILGNSLGYLPEPDDDIRILVEARRLLRAGGGLLVDVADGAVVSCEISPNVWHETGDDIVVCRQRELRGSAVVTREMVLSKNQGLIRDEAYQIRLFDCDRLSALVAEAKFKDVCVHRGVSAHRGDGDYGFMNRRFFLTGTKAGKHKQGADVAETG